jgi:type III secretion protein U
VSGHRTEAPTPRRLRDARRRGDVARARELGGSAALLAGLAAVAAVAPATVPSLARGLRAALARAVTSEPDPVRVLCDAAWEAARASAPACAAALVASALAALLLTGPGLSPGALRPRWARLDPAAGLRRMVAPSQWAAAALALAKACTLLAVFWSWLRDAAPGIGALPRAEPTALLRAGAALGPLALRLAATALAFGVADAALARWRHLRALRMSRDEVRREHKEDEGDPAHRAERRRRHRALLSSAPAARATVVVVNPTRLAVALRHDRGGDAAPRVIAKGAGPAAAAIRSAARRAGVPVVRDVPLARALHRLAEVGDEIPEELYEAAAAVLAHLYGPAPEGRP